MKPVGMGAAALIALFCLATPAAAEGPYYFHKRGVDRDRYMDDVNDCAELAGGVRTTRVLIHAYGSSAANNAIAAGLGSFFASIAAGRERRRLISRVERTCMADKGYERRSIDRASYGEIRKLESEARLDRMFALVASEEPVGEVLVE